MDAKIYICIFIAAGVTYLLRVLPLTVLKKPIKNRYIRSFLYYVPYVTLSVMTFPAILNVTGSWIPGAFALVIGAVCAWFRAGLFGTAVACCAAVFLAGLIF